MTPERLRTGLLQLGIEPAPELCQKYMDYVALLAKWNKAYNLTAIHDPLAMLERHVLDSLTVLPFIKGPRCLDVGTGAGLPGLVLALAAPETEWTLLDSNQKKLRFLRHVQARLGLANIRPLRARVEAHQDAEGFATIICRAFGPLRGFYDASRHLLQKNGRLLAMKAAPGEAELAAVRARVARLEIRPLPVPGRAARRCVVILGPGAAPASGQPPGGTRRGRTVA